MLGDLYLVIVFSWDMTSWNLVDILRCFGESCCSFCVQYVLNTEGAVHPKVGEFFPYYMEPSPAVQNLQSGLSLLLCWINEIY